MPGMVIGSALSFVGEGEIGATDAAAAAAPFAPVEATTAPARRSTRGFIELAPNLLLTTLAVVTAAPFHNADWPELVRRGRPAIEQHQNLLATTLAPAAPTPTVFRGPLISQPQQRARPFVEDAPNLLTTTLGAPAAAPFVPQDSLGAARHRLLVLDQHLNLLATTLKPAVPFSQQDWPLTKLTARHDLDPARSLLQTTLASAAQAPFVPVDWTSTVGRAKQGEDAPQNLLGLLTAAPAPAPFAIADWPAPRAVSRQDIEWTQTLLQTTLAPAPVAAPFTPIEVTVRAQSGRQEVEVSPNLLTSTLFVAPAPPAAIVEAPAGRKRRQPIIYRLWHKGKPLLFDEVDALIAFLEREELAAERRVAVVAERHAERITSLGRAAPAPRPPLAHMRSEVPEIADYIRQLQAKLDALYWRKLEGALAEDLNEEEDMVILASFLRL